MNDQHATSPPAVAQGGRFWPVALVLTLGALGLSAYLAFATLTSDGNPIGCGDTSGCGAVLGTQWSKCMGLPVSGLAAGLYLVILGTLLKRKQLGGWLLSTAAISILSAAAWFTCIQLFFFEQPTFCPYCMINHALGTALSIILLTAATGQHLPATLPLGILSVGALAIIQLFASNPTPIIPNAGGTQQGRQLTLLNGGLVLNLDEQMLLGSPDNPRLLIKMFDYNCPHCRHAHRLSQSLNNVTYLLLPVPMNPACNTHQNSLPLEQFKHSCTLAKVALAIHQHAPAQLARFDSWAYDQDWPHSADQAIAFASTLMDPAALQNLLRDPALDAILKRNTDAWDAARDAELLGGLPVYMAPGGGLTYGGIGDGTNLTQLLEHTHHSQSPLPAVLEEPRP